MQITFELTGEPDYIPENGITVMTEKMYRLVSNVVRKFSAKAPAECSFELYKLCCELRGGKDSKYQPPEGEILPEVNYYVQFHKNWRENIKSIASKMNMSESNLRLRFRQENGISLGSYLKAQKIELAKYRLQYTSQALSVIGRLCGYDSVFSFSRFFKNAVGMPPLKYRQQFQKSNADNRSDD